MEQQSTLECPRCLVGRIIGKRGETIKALQKFTRTHIEINQGVDPTLVTIFGTAESSSLALSVILDIINGTFKGFALLRKFTNAAKHNQPTIYAPGYGIVPTSTVVKSAASLSVAAPLVAAAPGIPMHAEFTPGGYSTEYQPDLWSGDVMGATNALQHRVMMPSTGMIMKQQPTMVSYEQHIPTMYGAPLETVAHARAPPTAYLAPQFPGAGVPMMVPQQQHVTYNLAPAYAAGIPRTYWAQQAAAAAAAANTVPRTIPVSRHPPGSTGAATSASSLEASFQAAHASMQARLHSDHHMPTMADGTGPYSSLATQKPIASSPSTSTGLTSPQTSTMSLGAPSSPTATTTVSSASASASNIASAANAHAADKFMTQPELQQLHLNCLLSQHGLN